MLYKDFKYHVDTVIAIKIELFFEADKKNNAAATFKVEVHHNTCPATFAILLFSDVSPSWVIRIGLSRTWNKPKIDLK